VEHDPQVFGDRLRFLVAGRSEVGAEFPCPQIWLVEALTSLDAAPELIPIGCLVFRCMFAQLDVCVDSVRDVA
jgi:hypothetical protein